MIKERVLDVGAKSGARAAELVLDNGMDPLDALEQAHMEAEDKEEEANAARTPGAPEEGEGSAEEGAVFAGEGKIAQVGGLPSGHVAAQAKNPDLLPRKAPARHPRSRANSQGPLQ